MTGRWRWRAIVQAATMGAAVVLGTAASAQTPMIEYYHLDELGSVWAATNAAGAVVSRHEYEPFGEERQPVVPPTTARQFTGKERDPETGLDYFGARYFRADLGQFTAVDPALDLKQALVEPQRWNRDACVTNNPLRYIDPDGRDRMGMYEPGQRGTAAPWRGFWTEVTTVGAVATAVVAPFFAPEVASAAVSCFLSPVCQQNALEVMAPPGPPVGAHGAAFASEQLLVNHFEKHRAELGATTAARYLSMASRFAVSGQKGVSTIARTNGDTLFYKAATNEFAVVAKNGVIRTYFKPEKGLAYWVDQVEKIKQ